MKLFLSNNAVILLAMLLLTFLAAGCHQDARSKVLKKMPARGTLSYNHVVYVENDGSCDIGQVIKITGGKAEQGHQKEV
ncbi:MAG: DUF6719 family protein [Candidatus Electrothrix scaldis]|nr:MAG: DUF6719 family protein [Candidatus Electrothrix sp. GW3-3]